MQVPQAVSVMHQLAYLVTQRTLYAFTTTIRNYETTHLAKAWQQWRCVSSTLHNLEALRAFKIVSRLKQVLRNVIEIGKSKVRYRVAKAFSVWNDSIAINSLNRDLIGKTRHIRDVQRQELTEISNEISTLKVKQKELQLIVERLKRREDAYQQKISKISVEQSRSKERIQSARISSRSKAQELKTDVEELRAHVSAVEDNVCHFIEEMSEMLEMQKTVSPRHRKDDNIMFSKLSSGLMASSMRLKQRTALKRKLHLSPSSSGRRK